MRDNRFLGLIALKRMGFLLFFANSYKIYTAF